jgi:hypothetical protein
MGFMNYLKITPQALMKPVENEKALAPGAIAGLDPPPSCPASSRSTALSGPRDMDDIKHQVMLNRLYQQQRSQLWI